MLRQARLGALLFGGMVSGALLVASSPAAAAQIVDDGAVLDATTTEGSPSESQPGWTLERLVSEVAAAVMALSSGSAATPPTAAPAAVVAPAPAPTTQSAPAPAVATKAPAAAVIAPEQVIVTEGDSLSRIAIRRGIAVEAMIAANPQLSNPMRLYPGDKVNLPKAAGAPTPAQ